MKTALITTFAVVSTFFVPMSASAALVAYEGFEYDISGSAALAGKGGAGDGWGGAWSGSGTIVADTMSYSAGDIFIHGGAQALKINGTNSSYFSRQFTAITGVTEVYFSFLFKSQAGASNDYVNFFLSENSDRANSAGIGDVAGTNRFGVRIFGNDTDINDSSQSGISYTPGGGEVFLLVGRISTDGTSGEANVFDKIDLWVNPGSTTLGEADWTSDRSTMLNTSVGFSYFGLQSSNVSSSDDIRIDAFRVGTDALSVLSPIPEPSTYAAILGCIVLAGGSLIRRGRRR